MSCQPLMIQKSQESCMIIRTKAVLKIDFAYPYKAGEVIECVVHMLDNFVYDITFHSADPSKIGTTQVFQMNFTIPIRIQDLIQPLDTELAKILYDPLTK